MSTAGPTDTPADSTTPLDLVGLGITAVVLDLDGVVTRTARLHAHAWKHLFDAYLRVVAERTATPFVPFDADADYAAHVDGLPRADGVRTFLASRGISLPLGQPDDSPEAETIHGLGNRKNAEFNRVLAEDGVEVFPGAVRWITSWRARGLKMALNSSSKNARRVLDKAHLTDLFDAIVDGSTGLPGKPAPDTFVHAAALVGARPDQACVVEDALAGVQSGRAGGFALVIGIDRGAGRQALQDAGADIVVNDLGDFTVPDPTAPRRPIAEIPSALDAFDALQRRLNGRRPVLFLDYDGTLTPIVERPELAVLSDDARAAVDALARALPVAVVSGRDRPDVERLVGLDSLIYAGSHGFDVTVPGQGPLDHGAGDFTELLDGVEAALRDGLRDIPGALIERKKFSIAAHYRQVADGDYPAFRAALDAVLRPGIKEKPGKKVFEFQPDVDWDKGKCVLFLLDALALNDDGHVAMFFGDDVTDEDAFAALHERGVCVVVADATEDPARTTAAHFRVDDPGQLIALLRRLTP